MTSYRHITGLVPIVARLKAAVSGILIRGGTSSASPLSGHGSCFPKTSHDPHYRHPGIQNWNTCPRIAQTPFLCTSVDDTSDIDSINSSIPS